MTGVEYYDAKKEQQVQEASVVVLAAWSAQNPRIMLNSATDKHPKGLANSSGLLGKYMMAHYASRHLGAVRRGRRELTWAPSARSTCRTSATTRPAKKGAFGSTFIVAGAALKTSDLGGFANARLDLFGPPLADFMKRAKRGHHPHRPPSARKCRMSRTASSLPSGKDEFGMPLARIIHSFDQDAVALWNANFEEGLEIAKATGAKEFWAARGNQPTIHLFGGTIMGTGAGNSVTNSYGQTHEIANLWVAGTRPVSDRGRVEPDLHDLRSVAARCRAARLKVGNGGGLIRA